MPTPYADALQAQLAVYKRQELLVTEDGLWAQNSRPYAHILPAASSDLNLCAPLRSEMRALMKERRSWTRHRDFHHLNSSQAMCWNVLMPALVLAGGLEQLGTAMGTPSAIKAMDFEAIPDQVEFTNFDCVLQLEDGGIVYVEAKLTEREFGGAAKNDKRELKRTDIYTPRLLGKVPSQLLEENSFFASYQLLRNLSHLKCAADRLVLLLPRASGGLVRQAEAFRALVLPPWQAQVSLVFVEDLIERLSTQTEGPTRLHFEECRRKYVLRESATGRPTTGRSQHASSAAG